MSTPSLSDPRVRRTRHLLREALLALAAERDFGAITVADIVRRADVNRNTFYLHYRDKDDLVAQALDSLFEEVTFEERAFTDAHGQLLPDVVPSPLRDLFRHVDERPELYRRLLGGTGSSAFAARLQSFHEAQFLRVWSDMRLDTTAASPPPEVRARCAAAATQGVIGWWLDSGRQESASVIAAWLWDLIRPFWFDASDVGRDPPEDPNQERRA